MLDRLFFYLPRNILFWIFFDRLTKSISVSFLKLNDSGINIFPGLNVSLAYNYGAAFSILNDGVFWQRLFFVVITSVVMVFIMLWLQKVKPQEKILKLGLSLILAGAVGNLYDRLYYGYVIDFIDVYYMQWHWPTFNIADSCICVGTILMLFTLWKKEAV